MNKYLLAFIPLVLIGIIGSYLYTHHRLREVRRLQEIRRFLPGSTVAARPSAIATCGCTIDTDEAFPTTPEQIKQAKIKAKREAVQEKIRETQIASRLHRLIHIGMPRKQVEQIMGESEGGETPPESFKGRSAVDSDNYGDYQIAFSAKDTVAWVRPL